MQYKVIINTIQIYYMSLTRVNICKYGVPILGEGSTLVHIKVNSIENNLRFCCGWNVWEVLKSQQSR